MNSSTLIETSTEEENGARTFELTLKSGALVEAMWSFPHAEKHPGARKLAILLPSQNMKVGDRRLLDLSSMLLEMGLAVFRCSAIEGGLMLNDLLQIDELAGREPRVNSRYPILMAFQETADILAREYYYRFYQVNPPQCVVLFSSSVGALDLNKFTCPYLVIHGEKDSRTESALYEEIGQAVHHHQMRYGDPTTRFLAPDAGSELGDSFRGLDPLVLKEVEHWLNPLPRKREQEAA